jgi:hypothetical protein
MLLHVVSHELRLQLPESATERLYDVVAATAGILTSLLGMGSHAHGQESGVADALLAQLLDLAARALPPLALGALLSLLFLATARRYSTTRWGQAFFSPRAGLDALLLTILIMSPIAAVGRLLVASGFASLSSEGIPRGSTKPGPVTSNRSRPSAAFLERLEAELPYLILAFLLAANIRVALPPELLPSIPWSAQVAGIVLLTRFARIPCGAAALLGLALMPHGLSLAAVMTLLLLGPEAGLAKLSFGSLMRALCLLVAALSLTWVSDVSSQRWEGAIQPQIAGVLLVVSLMLILWAIWRRGFRALFSELLPHHHTGLAPK